jgi:hypothetical protein
LTSAVAATALASSQQSQSQSQQQKNGEDGLTRSTSTGRNGEDYYKAVNFLDAALDIVTTSAAKKKQQAPSNKAISFSKL